MAKQLLGPFEKFVDSPHFSESEICGGAVTVSFTNKVRQRTFQDHATTTLFPLLQLGITVTASLCITAAHYRQSTNFANGPRKMYFKEEL
jgi:hypothetical protein